LSNKLKIRRNKFTITVLILIIFAIVLLINLFNLWIYTQAFRHDLSVYNSTLNKTVRVIVTVVKCYQNDNVLKLGQDMTFSIVRVMLPLAIMVICNVVLIFHIKGVRKNASRATSNQRKEIHFTLAVCFINGSFFVLNICFFIATIVAYYYNLTGTINTISFLAQVQISIFQIFAVLLSYMFTVCEFWIDLALNRLFRKEIKDALLILFWYGNKIVDETSVQTKKKRNSNRS